ncbi:MAG: GC-type dockerin domain-anchored protein [Patescibacteria group bacterium]
MIRRKTKAFFKKKNKRKPEGLGLKKILAYIWQADLRHKGLFIFSLILLTILGFLITKHRAKSADGSGVNTVSPNSAVINSTGNTFNFTFTAGETMDSGEVAITSPAGWSYPQATAGQAGYTTVNSSGIVADIVNNLDTLNGWTSTKHMELSADSGDKQEGTASIKNIISASASANESWCFNNDAAADWGAANSTNGSRIAFWIKSNTELANGDFYWVDSAANNLVNPSDSISISGIPENVWTYMSVTLGAPRNSVFSYGFKYAADLGAVNLNIDSISSLFDAADTVANWGGSSGVSVSLLGSEDNFKEGSGAIRCVFAASAKADGSCRRSAAANRNFNIGPGTTVNFWIRSSIALNAGDLEWMDDENQNLSSPEDRVSLPAIPANTWTYITLSAPNSANKLVRSYGFGQTVDKGAFTLDIDSLGKQVNSGDSITGWSVSNSNIQTISSDSAVFHEGAASLKNVAGNNIAVGDSWYQMLDSAQNWSGYITIGFWIRSSANQASNNLQFLYSANQDLSSPIASLNIGSLNANTWTFKKLILSGNRDSIKSFGFKFINPVPSTIYLDDILIGPGSLNFFPEGTAAARFLSLSSGETATFAYGFGGGNSGVIAPGTAGSYTFITKSRISDSGSLAEISTSPVVTVANSAAIKFVIIDPADSMVNEPVAIRVEAQRTDGSVDTAYQNNVTLAASGSATGAGLVNIVNGIGSATIIDTVAETVNLSLIDTQETGLDVSSTQDVVFSSDAVSSFTLNNPGGMTAGTRIAYIVGRKDQFDNPVTSGPTTSYLYTSSDNGKFYNAASGGSAINSVVIPDGGSEINFWYYDDTPGSYIITVSDNSFSPNGDTGIDDAEDSVEVVAAPIEATKFIIINPDDGDVGDSVEVRIEAQDNIGRLDVFYQDDITLITSGAATGGGLVDVKNGVGLINVTNTLAETVVLSLLDTEGTGLEISSVEDVIFKKKDTKEEESAGAGASRPVTVIRFFGRAYPGASAVLLARSGDQEIPLQYNNIVSENGYFSLEFSGKIFGYKSYGLIITDKDGRTTPAKFYNFDVNLYSVTDKDIFVPPTIEPEQKNIGKNTSVIIIGYATPGMRLEFDIDGKIMPDLVYAKNSGYYEYKIEAGKLTLGEHQIRARQLDERLGKESNWSVSALFSISQLSAPQTDLNGDGVIDISDWSMFLGLWSKQDARIDFNGDGKVDISDFSLFMSTVKK